MSSNTEYNANFVIKYHESIAYHVDGISLDCSFICSVYRVPSNFY